MSTPAGTAPERQFVRFTLSQRIEHLVQITSFTTLCVTGLAQRYNTSTLGDFTLGLIGGIDMSRAVHRSVGLILIAEGVYHAGALAYAWVKGKLRPTMLPKLSDATDAWHMILYFVGRRPTRARFDRYDFRQKVEYLSLLWGTVLMVATGLMMWYPLVVTRYLPGEVIPAAKAAHGGEAVLAALSILLWHMYGAHLCADVFPFDKTIFTGKISESRMHHEHPLELERILAESAEPAAIDKGQAT